MTGIDRIILNKIKINNFEDLSKKELTTTSKFSQYFEQRDELCEIKQSHHISISGNEYFISSLDFNPNRVLRGNNIGNSTIEDLIKALDIVISKLRTKGIDIDISEACIKYLEINKNIDLSFASLQEVLLAVGRANFKKAFGQHSFIEEDIPRLIKKDRSLYINLKDTLYNSERPEECGILIAYDKTFEALTKQNISVGKEITRVELKMGRDYYRQELQKRGYENSLEELIENYKVVDDIFKSSFKKFYVDRTSNYINKILKSNLEKDFISFKRTEKEKRKKRAECVAKEKEIPKHLKETRGVYEYLLSSSWVFDVSFLGEIIERHIDNKSKNRELIRVRTKYKNINNADKLNIFSGNVLNIFLPH